MRVCLPAEAGGAWPAGAQASSWPGTSQASIQPTPSNEECGIREVWAYNLDREFDNIRKVAQTYKYVAMVSAGEVLELGCVALIRPGQGVVGLSAES